MTLNASTLCRYEDKRGQAEKRKNAKKSGMQKENGLQIVTPKKCDFLQVDKCCVDCHRFA